MLVCLQHPLVRSSQNPTKLWLGTGQTISMPQVLRDSPKLTLQRAVEWFYLGLVKKHT